MNKVQNINVKYDGYKFDITKSSPLFSDAKIYVMYHGENRNNSHISKEDVDRAIKSIYNIPIVGEFIEDEEGEEDSNFGGHGGKLIIDDNGSRFIQTTKPMGVVPESANVYWEMVEDEKGREREYLVVEGALLWNRYQEAVETLKSANFGQSMEIEAEDGFFDDDSGIYHITDFSFSAFCVLGIDDRKNGKVEPAFEDSKIITYSKEFSDELKEMKSELSTYLTSYSKKEEVETLGKNKEKEFDLETAKDAVVKAEDSKKAEDVEKARELVAELEDGEEKDKLIERLDAIKVEEDEKDEEDFDLKSAEEAVEKAEETKDKEDVEKARELVSELEDGEEKDKLIERLDAIDIKENEDEEEGSDDEDYSVKYGELKKKYDDLVAEVKDLEDFKKGVQKEEHEKASIELFDSLGLDEEDVKDLDIYKYTIEELEDKCYSILGRKLATKEKEDFSLENDKSITSNKIDLSRASKESKTTRYGNLFNKFSTK